MENSAKLALEPGIIVLSPKRMPRRDRKPEGERVSSHSKIIAMLRQLEADHELLSVSVPGCADSTNTAVLGVKEEGGYFLLDEFASGAANQAFSEHKTALVKGRLRGTELCFNVTLIKIGSESNILLYAVRIPNLIIRKQRRHQFRLRLNPNLSIPLSIPDLCGSRAAGEAFDLSASGVGAFLNTRSHPGRGDLLHEVSICLPNDKPLVAQLEVRFARADSVRHMLRIGGRFVSLNKQEERKLERFLAEQQRKRRRHDNR